MWNNFHKSCKSEWTGGTLLLAMPNILEAKAFQDSMLPKMNIFQRPRRHSTNIYVHWFTGPHPTEIYLLNRKCCPLDFKHAVKDVICRSWWMLTQREKERERGECVQEQNLVYLQRFLLLFQAVVNWRWRVVIYSTSFDSSSYTHYTEILFMLGSSDIISSLQRGLLPRNKIWDDLQSKYMGHGPTGLAAPKKTRKQHRLQNCYPHLGKLPINHQNWWLFQHHPLLLFPKIWELALLVGFPLVATPAKSGSVWTRTLPTCSNMFEVCDFL